MKADKSNTWTIFIVLITIFFLFQLNVIFSAVTSTQCRTFEEFWFISQDGVLNVFNMHLLIFLLLAACSVIELVKGILRLVTDVPVAIGVNALIIICCLSSLYVMYVELEYIENKLSVKKYRDIYLKPHVDGYETHRLFGEYRRKLRCEGTLPYSYPRTQEEYDQLYNDFLEAGYVRTK